MAEKQELTKLRLILEVDYIPNGVSENALKEMLLAIADKAAADGLMTGETPAEVELWYKRVERRE